EGSRVLSFDSFVLEDGMPIYLQILLFVKRGIIAGTVADGDELPSRRVLSALLGVNPNTVQKAYRLLEEEGLVQSHSGAKSYMVLDGEKTERVRGELLENDAKSIVSAMRQMGLSKEEALTLIETYWE
ncbi:MAG: GntR family transcriptional regulator, partial [Oscillospiraceae bacterium]